MHAVQIMQLDRLSPTNTVGQVPPVPVFSKTLGSWHFAIGRTVYDDATLTAHYDKQSDSWDTTIERHGFTEAYTTLISQIWRQARYRQNAGNLNVLDAGIGTGAMSVAFARVLRRKFQLTGIDLSPAMLRQAAARLRQLDISTQLRCASLSDLPFAGQSFDVVLVAHVLEHAADPQLGLAEAYRVLKPGGVLISAITRNSTVGAYIQVKWRTHRVRPSQARQWMREVGFRSVRSLPFGKGTPARQFSVGHVGRKPL